MKILIIIFNIMRTVSLFSQNNPDGSIDFDYIAKPGEIRYTPSEKLAIDSFTTMVNEYKRLEKRIIEKLSNDSISSNLKSNFIDQYVCNFPYFVENNLRVFTRLIRKDLLLFPSSKKIKGEYVFYNCTNNTIVRKLIADFIVGNKELYDCNFFNDLNFYYENRKFGDDLKLKETKSTTRQMNINCVADLLKDYEPEFRKVVSDEYSNDCYRANAKLILEALEKNK